MELNQFRNVDVVLDKANDNFIQKQFVSAGDKDGRSLTVQITENGAVGEVIGLTLNLRWHNEASGLTDLSAFYVVDKATSVFKIDYPQNMLTPGKVIAYIQILHGGKVTHTKPFEITVQNLAGTTKGVLATAEYGALVTTLAKANEFSAQLAQKLNQGEVSVSDINKNLGKFDQTYMTDEFLQQVAGSTPINAVPAKNSITADKTVFFEPSKNLFNSADEDVQIGKYYNTTNTLIVDSNINQSGFIPVEAGQDYTANYNGLAVNWYDADKAFLTFTPSVDFLNNKYVTAPTGAVYARLGSVVASWDTFQVEKGRVSTTYETYKPVLKKTIFKPKGITSDELADGSVTPSKIPNNSITSDKTNFFEPIKNLFNPNDTDVLIGKYYNSTNVLTTNSGINQSGFIPVVAGQEYTASYTGIFVNWYDSNKTFLSSTSSTDFMNNKYVIAPVNTMYARFSAVVVSWATFQVEKGRVSTSYEPFRMVVKQDAMPVVKTETLKTVNWASLGDSITAQEKWQPYVVSELGLTHTNCGIGSTTVAGVANVNLPCMWEDVRLNAVKNANPDIVTILGGANDQPAGIYLGDETEFDKALADKDKPKFYGAYSYIIENLLTWKPTLRIILLTTTWGHNENTNATTGLTYRDFAEATKAIAWFYGLPCVDLRGEIGLNKVNATTYLPDNIHPNAEGGKRIAERVIPEMKKITLL